MKKILTLMILGVMLSWGANGAWADGPYPTAMTDGTFGPAGSVTPSSTSYGGSEFEVYNAVNLLLGTSYTNNAQLDPLEYTGNASTWEQTSSGGGYAVIGLGAAATNTLEVYNTATPGTLINPIGTGFSGNGMVGNGTINSPYIGTSAVFSSGTQFGLAINSSYTSTNTWYSDPTLNSDGMDHIMVYNLSALTGTTVYIYDPNTGTEQPVVLDDPYLVTFEDLSLANNGANSDMDYNDLDVLVNGASPFSAPVPEPLTLALFSLGLLAMAGFALRQKLMFLSNWA